MFSIYIRADKKMFFISKNNKIKILIIMLEIIKLTVKILRKNLAFGIRLIGFVLTLPSAVLYDLSDLIKNNEQQFDF